MQQGDDGAARRPASGGGGAGKATSGGDLLASLLGSVAAQGSTATNSSARRRVAKRTRSTVAADAVDVSRVSSQSSRATTTTTTTSTNNNAATPGDDTLLLLDDFAPRLPRYRRSARDDAENTTGIMQEQPADVTSTTPTSSMSTTKTTSPPPPPTKTTDNNTTSEPETQVAIGNVRRKAVGESILRVKTAGADRSQVPRASGRRVRFARDDQLVAVLYITPADYSGGGSSSNDVMEAATQPQNAQTNTSSSSQTLDGVGDADRARRLDKQEAVAAFNSAATRVTATATWRRPQPLAVPAGAAGGSGADALQRWEATERTRPARAQARRQQHHTALDTPAESNNLRLTLAKMQAGGTTPAPPRTMRWTAGGNDVLAALAMALGGGTTTSSSNNGNAPDIGLALALLAGAQ